MDDQSLRDRLAGAMVRIVAYTHLNFVLGSGGTHRAPPGENYCIRSDPMPSTKAQQEIGLWLRVCEDRWRVVIEPELTPPNAARPQE